MPEDTDTIGRATYDPGDNKIRIYPDARLDPETYAKVKAAGFIWAPKQELFVAPMWTPERADLCLELCGGIEDEDTSLVERAEERADRFETYSEHRAEDAERAREAVSAIADNIPLGQPILVGHHSEKHARRDAEKIQNGMRRAVDAFRQSGYWKQRAAGAIHAAKYKELPGVRARRIKGLEADQRKREKEKAENVLWLKLWSMPKKEGDRQDWDQRPTASNVLGVSEYPSLYAVRTLEEVIAHALSHYPAMIEYCDRWLEHIAGRLEYERAMLAESGGTAADKTKPEKGGACRCWASRGGWLYIFKVNRVSVTIEDNWGNGGHNFNRTMPLDKLAGVMSRAEVEAAKADGRATENANKTGFYLAEGGIDKAEAAKRARETPAERNMREHIEAVRISGHPCPCDDCRRAGVGEVAQAKTAKDFDAMEQTLRAGVQVVTAPQLFPTPVEVAAQMVKALDVQDGQRILEPSAGTGRLIDAVALARPYFAQMPKVQLVAVEVSPVLFANLRAKYDGPSAERIIIEADFLTCNGDLGKFDRIIMNPPFERGADIQHIRHALTFLKPGGRLVALCANGPRQSAELRPLCQEWHDLPPGSFKESGTMVNAAMLVFDR
jgi:phospholipid N-methyltransferase